MLTATTQGPTPTLDLDAGTTLPRAFHAVGAALVIAGLAATLLSAGDGRTPDPLTTPRIAPQVITVPALRPAWTLSPSPSWPVGPAAALVDLAGARGGIGQ